MPEVLPRVFRPRTIRVQLTLAITAVVALVVALAGLAVVLYADHRDRDDVDRVLTVRAAQVRTAAAKSGTLSSDGTFVIRLLDASGVRKTVGSSTKFSIPVKDGYSTVTAEDGSHWRSWAETLKTGAQLQVLISLKDVEEQHAGNVRMIDLIVILAAVVTAVGTWFVGGLVLRPLLKLAEGAKDITPDDPTMRLPVVESPPEVASLGNAINGALDRMAVVPPSPEPVLVPDNSGTEEFAKETAEDLRAPLAELGEGLDQLLDNPEMPATMRHLYLASIQTEYRRILATVDDLESRAASR